MLREDGMKHAELLAPAGSIEAFEAAVNAGADAVYLAGSRFGARAYAENFDDNVLIETIRKAHLCGVKVNLTVNTLAREKELSEILNFLRPLCDEHLDAVIVQDIGVLSMLHRELPDLALHVSTQLSVSTVDAVRYLAGIGATRVVPARELSLDEIAGLKSELPIEVETFIHGAMCYCYSGKCLLSSFLGGRSGNRGRCAQPCRLPYRVLNKDGHAFGPDAGKKEYYPLSMRDMQTIEILPELIEAGIDSFKIEGRMKKPEYAAGVTSVYRKYMDLYYSLKESGREDDYRVEQEDLAELESLYLRSERSEGYYHQYNGRSLITIGQPGYRGADENLLGQIRSTYVRPVKGLSVEMKAAFMAGKPCTLEVSSKPVLRGGDPEIPDMQESFSVYEEGEVVKTAEKRPLDEETIRKNLGKTGDTVYEVENTECEINSDIFLPIGRINKLRRGALEKLEEKLLNGYNEKRICSLRTVRKSIEAELKDEKRVYGASFPDGRVFAAAVTKEQAATALRNGADLIIDDSTGFCMAGQGAYLALPYAVRNKTEEFLNECLHKLGSGEYSGAMVRNIEGLSFLRYHGYTGPVLADSPLYCWNHEAAEVLREDVQGMVFPLELCGREIEDTFGRTLSQNGILMAYGRAPMMVSAGCIRKTEKACTGHEEGFLALRDRKNEVFPVRTVCRCCTNIIYNSVPISLHKAVGDRLLMKTRALLLSFTTESPDEVQNITRLYREIADGDRMNSAAVFSYTTGHYKKGAL